MSSQQETAPRLAEPQEGDHDRFAHYVRPASAVVEAMVTGRPCRALCGKEWVPTRDPERFPICPTCAELLARAQGA